MCGCNTKVKYSNEKPTANVVEYTVPAPKRSLLTACDTLGKCGIIQENTFKPSESNHTGSYVKFSRVGTNQLPAGFPKEQFQVTFGTANLSVIGLRQLAEEFAAMADELDGQKTIVSMAGQAVVAKKRKAKKAVKKVAKKKAA